MPISFNDETGDIHVLDKGGQWVKAQRAENPDTKERYYLDGNEWKTVPLSTAERNAGRAAAVLQGPAMGFGDEFVATLENPIESISALSKYARPGAIAAELAGQGGPSTPRPGYEKSLEKFRGIESRYRQDSPVESLALTAGGGLVGGGVQAGRGAFNAVASALPRAGRVAQAAATGAGFGAVGGFGSGEGGTAERLVSATFGAGIGAGAGATLEVAIPALARLVQSVRGNPRLWSEQSNRLTPAGEQAAREAGLDPAQASAALQREFATAAQNALRPEEAAAVAQARSLPVPVNLRRGQSTLDPDQQMFESQAGKGVFGPLAGETIRASDEAQQNALRANVPVIQQRIAGTQNTRVPELGAGVNQVQQALVANERSAARNVERLYETARSGRDASISRPIYNQGVFNVFNRVLGSYDSEAIPNTARVLQRFARAIEGQPNAEPLVSEMFAIRARLAAIQQATKGGDGLEYAASGTAKRELDNWLTQLMDESALSGDPSAVARWRAAIAARREYGRRFESDNMVEKLTSVQPTAEGEARILKLDPSAAVNLIFGRDDIGWVSKAGLFRDLMTVRRELGPQSSAWHALREEAFMRIARTAEGASGPTGREFSGANFAKAWEQMQAKNPQILRILFNEQERNLISQFATVARRVTTNVKGGNNSSNTSVGNAQVIRRLFTSAFMGPRMAAFLESVPIVRGLQNIGQEMRAQSAVLGRLQQGVRPQPTPQAVNRAVEGSGGALASALVQQTFGPSQP